MPTYEYACRSCGSHIEVYQRFSDPPLTECGVCGGPLRKVFHPAGILFKGSGFYATDSRRGAGAGASGDGGEAREGTPKRDGKAGTAPATEGSKAAVDSGASGKASASSSKKESA